MTDTKQVDRSNVKVGDRIVNAVPAGVSKGMPPGWPCEGVLEVIKLPDSQGRLLVKCSGCHEEWRTGLGGRKLTIEVTDSDEGEEAATS